MKKNALLFACSCFPPALLLVLLFVCVSCLVAQPGQQSSPYPYPPQLLSELKQIQQAALRSDYAYTQLSHLTNNIGPRLTGSSQAQQAVEYVAAEMRRLGLDVQLEKLTVPHWVRGQEAGELIQFPGQAPDTTQKIVLTALGGSVATPAEGLTAEVVVVNNFDELNALGRERVAGKIVLFNKRFDKQMAAEGYGGSAYGQAVVFRGAGASAAARLGAVASLVRSPGGGDNRLAHTGAMGYAADSPRIPAAAVTAEDADLLSYLVAQGPVRFHLILTPQTLPDAVSYNVIGDLKGSEHPEQMVIVSGHLDSWDLGTGALDDAAGVAVAMQTAQVLEQLHLRPKRTLRVVAWMNEENGLVGGRTYAKDFAGELANHVAAIESDLGAGHPLGFNARVVPKALRMLRPVSTVLESSGATLMNPSDETGSDISPLEPLGVPTFGLFQDSRTYFNYHHTAADTLDKIVPSELAENAAAMAVLAYAIANLPDLLPR
jgi:carboxypeptidase Q